MKDARRKRLHAARWLEDSRFLSIILAIAAACSSAAFAEQPAGLTSLRAIHSLTKAQAREGLPVAFEATVTYYNRSGIDLFVDRKSVV